MTTYRLHITRSDPNPNYEEQAKAWKSRGGWDNQFNREFGDSQPSPTIESRTLDVTLTEAEYEAIKQAVLATFK